MDGFWELSTIEKIYWTLFCGMMIFIPVVLAPIVERYVIRPRMAPSVNILQQCQPGANLHGAWIRGADLSNRDLTGIAFSSVIHHPESTSYEDVDIGWDVKRQETISKKVTVKHPPWDEFTPSNLQSVNFTRSNLSNAYFDSIDMGGIIFDQATLYRVRFCGAFMRSAVLTGAELSFAEITADLINANFTGANLYCANLNDTNLTGANLAGANLILAKFQNVNLCGANLEYAILTDASFTNCVYDSRTRWGTNSPPATGMSRIG